MKIVYKQESIKNQNNEFCIAFSYPTNDKDISGALIELRGRYPTKGTVVNLKCKEMAYVIKGSGKLFVEKNEFVLSKGDLVLINPNEKYYWDGNMTLFMPCSPSWYPEQHKEAG